MDIDNDNSINSDKDNPFDEIKTEKTETEQTEQIEQIEQTKNADDNETDTLKEQYDELNNKYIRLAADFDNFRKRTQTEKEELSQYATVKILSQLTNALDTFDRAQEHLKNVDDSQTVKDGYDMAYKQLLDLLKKIGLEEMEALGKPFDPSEHEAVTQIQTDEYEPDCVAAVMQKGYKLDKKVVRPALVGVATKKEEE